jgi:hypothetical protein
MDKKELCLLFAVVIFLFLIETSFAEVETLGVFKQNDCVGLLQTCSNCTFSNLTSVILPNGTQELISKLMTKHGMEYNYTYCNTSAMGTYIANGYSDVDGINTVWAYDFEITPSGANITTSQGIIYLIFLVIIFFIFGLCVYGSFKLPWRDIINDEGMIMSKNDLKWVKLFCMVGTYLTFLFITAIVYTLSDNFLYWGNASGYAESVYRVTLAFLYPIMILLPWVVIYLIFQEKKVKKLIERGLPYR